MRDAPRRLLHVFATFDAGGPQVCTLEVCRRLGDAFVHRFVAADGRAGAASRLGELDASVVALPRQRGNIPQLRAMRSQVREFGPDLVLTYNWGAILGALAARLARRAFVHHEEVVPNDERGAGLRRRDLMRRFVLRGAGAVVVPSGGLWRKATTVWGVPAARVHHVPNGVDLVAHHPRATRGAGPMVVGCVAHARPEKNLPRLLRAFAACDAGGARRTGGARGTGDVAELHMIGGGPGIAECRQLAERLGIAERVRWFGVRDDTPALYRAMDVVVLSSDDEQMPLAVLEAMAHGLPVIATRVGDVAAMMPASQHAFLVPVSADAHTIMARHLDELLSNADLRARLGARNREFVTAHFDLHRVAERYLDIFEAGCRRVAEVPA